MGAADANLIWWVNTKAFTGLLLHRKFLSHQTPTFCSLKYFLILPLLLHLRQNINYA